MMESRPTGNRSRFAHLDRSQAADLLRRRLMTIGGVTGAIMGVVWTLVAGALFIGFPPIGTPPFYVLLFLSVIVLSASGILVGRYFFTKIMAGKK